MKLQCPLPLASAQPVFGQMAAGVPKAANHHLQPNLTAAGTARDRLALAVLALFDVAEAHLPLLMASDQVFHRASVTGLNFNEPFSRLFRDGLGDGRLQPPGGDPDQAADLFFNTACWPYVHLSGRHRWDWEKLRSPLSALGMPPAVDSG